MLACEICSRTSDRDREIENLREDREAILTIDARESKEEYCDALEVLARHHDDCESSLRSMGVTSRDGHRCPDEISRRGTTDTWDVSSMLTNIPMVLIPACCEYLTATLC